MTVSALQSVIDGTADEPSDVELADAAARLKAAAVARVKNEQKIAAAKAYNARLAADRNPSEEDTNP